MFAIYIRNSADPRIKQLLSIAKHSTFLLLLQSLPMRLFSNGKIPTIMEHLSLHSKIIKSFLYLISSRQQLV